MMQRLVGRIRIYLIRQRLKVYAEKCSRSSRPPRKHVKPFSSQLLSQTRFLSAIKLHVTVFRIEFIWILQVINDYLKLVTKSGNAPQRVTCFTTYMITQITKGSNYLNHFCNNKVCFQGSIQLFLAYPYIWQRVKESEVYGSKKDIYFVPINKDGNHWVLVVFYANKKGKVFGQFCC